MNGRIGVEEIHATSVPSMYMSQRGRLSREVRLCCFLHADAMRRVLHHREDLMVEGKKVLVEVSNRWNGFRSAREVLYWSLGFRHGLQGSDQRSYKNVVPTKQVPSGRMGAAKMS